MKNKENTRKPDTLLELLAALKAEVGRLSATHEEHARSIAGYAQVAAHEAAREKKSPQLLRHSREGLALSVKGFEVSHPRLVEVVNDLCTMLSQIGI